LPWHIICEIYSILRKCYLWTDTQSNR